MAARGSVLVMTMLEEDQRMDIKWNEQVARTMARNAYLKGLQPRDGTPRVAHHDPVDPKTPELGSFAELLQSVSLPTPSRIRSAGSLPPASPGGAGAQLAVLEQALDLAGKENGKLRQHIRNLEWELNVGKAAGDRHAPSEPASESHEEDHAPSSVCELAGFDDIPLAESMHAGAPPKPVRTGSSPRGGALGTPTPAERAWKRALDLSVLPRTISEESFQEETYDWRRTLEMREAAVLRRERLLETRETEQREVDKLKSDYEQQIKELAIKEKEFKLRFRGVEELEARGKDMARKLEEMDARERAVLEREKAVQVREDEVIVRERQVAASGTTPAPPAAPPQTLTLSVPTLSELSGEYVLADGLHAGYPFWVCDGERVVYHDRATGRWFVGFEESREQSLAWMASLQPHQGRFPNAVASWGVAEDEGGECLPADVEVTGEGGDAAPPPAAAAPRAPPPDLLNVVCPMLGDLNGRYELMGDTHAALPMWCYDGQMTMYSHEGRWHVGFEESREDGRAWMQSMDKHEGALPHTVGRWGLAEDEGGEVQLDEEIEVTACEAAAAAAPSESEIRHPALKISVPTMGDLSGTYTLSEDERGNLPTWVCDDKVLYSEARKWVIGFEHEIDDGVVWMASTEKHDGAMPHTIASWGVVECEGGDFVHDPDVGVHPA